MDDPGNGVSKPVVFCLFGAVGCLAALVLHLSFPLVLMLSVCIAFEGVLFDWFFKLSREFSRKWHRTRISRKDQILLTSLMVQLICVMLFVVGLDIGPSTLSIVIAFVGALAGIIGGILASLPQRSSKV